jgi:hypothetical protein
MGPILAVPTAAGGEVLFDVVEASVTGPEPVGRLRDVADFNVDQTLAAVAPAAGAALDAFRALRPDDVTLQFGIRMDAQLGCVIARTGMAANLTVTLHWAKPSPETTGAQDLGDG